MCVTVDDIIQSETDDIHYDAFERDQRQQQKIKTYIWKCFENCNVDKANPLYDLECNLYMFPSDSRSLS